MVSEPTDYSRHISDSHPGAVVLPPGNTHSGSPDHGSASV